MGFSTLAFEAVSAQRTGPYGIRLTLALSRLVVPCAVFQVEVPRSGAWSRVRPYHWCGATTPAEDAVLRAVTVPLRSSPCCISTTVALLTADYLQHCIDSQSHHKMETSTYIILALLALFLFGPVSLRTPPRHRSILRPSVLVLHAICAGDVESSTSKSCFFNKRCPSKQPN